MPIEIGERWSSGEAHPRSGCPTPTLQRRLSELLMDWALWLKALHIMGFAAWMAGMWYLPRLLIYHSGAAAGSETSETFKVMERRLLKAITTPAMVVTLIAGLAVATLQGQWSDPWLHAKLLLVLLLLGCHGVLARDVRRFAADERPRSATWYRAFNEAPTALFIGIVLLVVLKPF
jgi:putative membrane protein